MLVLGVTPDRLAACLDRDTSAIADSKAPDTVQREFVATAQIRGLKLHFDAVFTSEPYG